MTTTDTTRDLSERFSQAWLAGDAEAIGALLAEEITYVPPPSLALGPHEGREAAAAALAEPLGRDRLKADTVRREQTLSLADGDGALLKFGVTAETFRGALYRNEIGFVITWKDGEIVAIHEFADTLNDYDRKVVEDIPQWP
jgi:ketosteroid isomerase-like protein